MPAAVGIEVNSITIPSRHSSEAILRYVADAPLKSLRADLGLESLSEGRSPESSPSQSQSAVASAQMRARIQKLEASLHRLEDIAQTQAQVYRLCLPDELSTHNAIYRKRAYA